MLRPGVFLGSDRDFEKRRVRFIFRKRAESPTSREIRLGLSAHKLNRPFCGDFRERSSRLV
jgi:hypothetical protein